MNQPAMQTTVDWLVVASVEEVTGQQPVGVSCHGYEFVLFRDAQGVARALENRCPHRRVPLSQGKIIEGSIRCAYHGWTFDGSTGACVDVPNLKPEENLSANLRVAHYPVTEHQGFICVWVGDGEPTDTPPFRDPEIAQPDCETHGSGVVALATDHYRDMLFDAPQILFEISDIRITDFYLSDLRYDGDSLVIDREAEWGDASKPANIKAVDRSLVLRTEHAADINKVLYKLIDETETVLAMLSLAYYESRRGTTRHCWRFLRDREFGRLRPARYRLKFHKQAPVRVFSALDGNAVAATLMGPSAEAALLFAQKSSVPREELAL